MEEQSVNVRRFGSNQQQSRSLADAVTDLRLESVPPDLR
jgi:hypothetical protein